MFPPVTMATLPSSSSAISDTPPCPRTWRSRATGTGYRAVRRGEAEGSDRCPSAGVHLCVTVRVTDFPDVTRRGQCPSRPVPLFPSIGRVTDDTAADAQAQIFPPIGDYGFLSDCENSCLVAPDSSVEWLCLPRPDSPSVFGALLDRTAGNFRFGPNGTLVPHHRRYVPGTMVLETTWHTPTGWLLVQDLLVIEPVTDGVPGPDYRRAPGDAAPPAPCCGWPPASRVRSRWW